MATPTYEPIASITLGSSASSVTFSSIPQDYRDLVLVVNGALVTGKRINPTINGDIGSNYSHVLMSGDGATDTSFSGTTTFIRTMDLQALDGEQVQLIMQFMDYSATDKHKTIIHRVNSENETTAGANRFASTNAITSIELPVGGGSSYASGSTFALYGIVS